MIVVDSSIWIQAFRDAEGREAPELARLLDEDRAVLVSPVRMELLLGATRGEGPRLRRLFSALPCWYPNIHTWKQAESRVEPALRAGQRFGFADLLIGAMAQRHRANVWSLDSDFERLAGLGLIGLYRI